MNRDQKAAVIEEVSAQIKESGAVFAVDYRGITVAQVADLRTRLSDAGARFRVVKNTLTEIAADRAGAEPLKGVLDGPTAFTFVRVDGDVALAAKALAQFKREHNVLEFKGGVMDGEALTVEQLMALSVLPAREVLHGQLVGIIASPITGFVRTLNALLSGVAIQLQQIVEQGLLPAGDAPAEAAPAEESAAEEPVAEEPAAEEPPAEEASAEEEPAEDASAEEQPEETDGAQPAEPAASAETDGAQPAEPAASAETEAPSEGEDEKEG